MVPPFLTYNKAVNRLILRLSIHISAVCQCLLCVIIAVCVMVYRHFRIAVGVNRTKTGSRIPCTHLSILDRIREILLGQVAEVCRNRITCRSQHVLICENVLLIINGAEYLNTVDRRCIHSGLIYCQRCCNGEIVHRTAGICYIKALDTAVRRIRTAWRIGRNGLRYRSRFDVVCRIRRCGYDQFLDVFAVHDHGRVVAIDYLSLAAQFERNLPVGEGGKGIIIVQRYLIFTLCAPALCLYLVQTNADIRLRQNCYVIRRIRYHIRWVGVLEQADRTNLDRNRLACRAGRKALRQLERTGGNALAVARVVIDAGKRAVPQALSLLIRDKAQVGEHGFAVHLNFALVVQRTAVVGDGNIEAAVLLRCQLDTEVVVQLLAAVRRNRVILEFAVIGADIGIHIVQCAICCSQCFSEVVIIALIHSEKVCIDTALIDREQLMTRYRPAIVIVAHQITVGLNFGVTVRQVFILRKLNTFIKLICKLRTAAHCQNLIIQVSKQQLTRTAAARIIFASVDANLRAAARSAHAPCLAEIVVVTCILFIQTCGITRCQGHNCIFRFRVILSKNRKAVLNICAVFCITVTITKNTASIAVSFQSLRIIAAAVDIQHNIPCSLFKIIRTRIIRREEAHNAGCHGCRVDFNARPIHAVCYIDGKLLCVAF